MRFSTIFTVLTAGAMAFASAVPGVVVKRGITQYEDAFTTLHKKCDDIFPQFADCHDDDCTNTIVLEIVAVIKECHDNIISFPEVFGDNNLAIIVANVVIDIADTLDNHKKDCGDRCPNIINTYAQVDIALKDCLAVAFNLCLGLALLVSVLLLGLLVTLKDIVFTLVIAVCLL